MIQMESVKSVFQIVVHVKVQILVIVQIVYQDIIKDPLLV